LGTETSTPDFDFETFQRRSQLNGRDLTVREIMLIDSITPYPRSDLVILISVPSEIRRARVMSRDRVWGTQVAKRWANLELTWEQAQGRLAHVDLELDGRLSLDLNAADLAERLRALLEPERPG